METDTIQGALNAAFWLALLLAGDTTIAEAAVLDGIDACEDVLHRSLVIEAVRSTIRQRASASDAPGAVQLLPQELGRLFMLQQLSRDCFVLRILVGLPAEVCAELLDISITEFEAALYAALNQLPLLCSRNT